MDGHIAAIKETVVKGGHKRITEQIEKALQDGVDPEKIINEAMISAMDEVGRRFTRSEIFVPEMLVAAVTMKNGLDLLKTLLKADDVKSKGTVLMCTVQGDIHDIGKNLVVMMLEGAGFTVINLGVDVGVENLIEKVNELKPDILGLSALLTTTMPEMKSVIDSLEENGLRNDVKVMVGGAPVDEAFAQEIGADAYGKDAAEAVLLARRFVL